MSIPWDWIAGAITVISIELTVRLYWQGWLLGLLNQVFWVGLIISRELWGLLPLTLILCWQYFRALQRWRRKELTL